MCLCPSHRPATAARADAGGCRAERRFLPGQSFAHRAGRVADAMICRTYDIPRHVWRQGVVSFGIAAVPQPVAVDHQAVPLERPVQTDCDEKHDYGEGKTRHYDGSLQGAEPTGEQ
jgi:hypothetical protein